MEPVHLLSLSLSPSHNIITYHYLDIWLISICCCAILYVSDLRSLSLSPPPPLAPPSWYHGSVSRQQAEAQLQRCREASFLVRDSESGTSKYSIALKWVCRCVSFIWVFLEYTTSTLYNATLDIFIYSVIFINFLVCCFTISSLLWLSYNMGHFAWKSNYFLILIFSF